MTEFGPSNFAKFNSLSSQTNLSAVLLKMQKERLLSTNMAATVEVRECLRAHLIDVVRFLEGGNHDCNTFDYTLFRLDWVLNVLARHSDTETTRADTRIVHLVRDVVTNANHSRSTDATFILRLCKQTLIVHIPHLMSLWLPSICQRARGLATW